MIELNRVHREYDGKHSYDQLIFYEWSPDYRRYDVIDWWLVDRNEVSYSRRGKWAKRVYSPNMIKSGSLTHYVVRSAIFIETITLVDRERLHKRVMPEKMRGRLSFLER